MLKLFSKKRQEKKLKPSNNIESLKVIELNPNTSGLKEGLGISEERAKEIVKEIDLLFIKKENIIEVMEELTSGFLTHPNESFFAAIHIAFKIQAQSNPLQHLLRNLNH